MQPTKNRVWTDAERTQILDWWNSGYPVWWMMRELACTPGQISGMIERMQHAGTIKSRNPNRDRELTKALEAGEPAWTLEQEAFVVAKFAENWPDSAIGRALNPQRRAGSVAARRKILGIGRERANTGSARPCPPPVLEDLLPVPASWPVILDWAWQYARGAKTVTEINAGRLKYGLSPFVPTMTFTAWKSQRVAA